MLTWTTVGMPVHSSFSSAICVQSMEESQRTVPTKLDQVYTCICMYISVYFCINVFNQCVPDDLLLELVFFNTFEELNLPIKGPMEDAGVVKLYEPSPTPCLFVAPAENMVAGSPLCHCFRLEMRLQGRRSLTCTASARIQVSPWAALTQHRWTAGVTAMSMRLTRASGIPTPRVYFVYHMKKC
jgi:hypothetical protein